MTVLDFAVFAGVAPSVTARALGEGFAQDNTNLFLRSGEFWPLAGDKAHSTCPVGTRTIHRLQRNAAGDLIKDPGAPLRTYPQLLSFVKGQINDERTERTCYTFDDGSARPRVLDVSGGDRVLGVPRPVRPAVLPVVVDEFSQSEAQLWLYGEFAESLRAAIVDSTVSGGQSEPHARYTPSGTILAGAKEKGGLLFYGELSGAAPGALAPYNLYALVGSARVAEAGLDVARLGAVAVNGGWAFPLCALPAGVNLDRQALERALSLLEYPQHAGQASGTAVLTPEHVSLLGDAIERALQAGVLIDGERLELTQRVKEFYTLMLTKAVTAVGSTPVAPTKPRGAQYDSNGERTSAWATYDTQLTSYNLAMANLEAKKATWQQESAAINARAIELQSQCAQISASIEQAVSAKLSALTVDASKVGQLLDDMGGAGILQVELTQRRVDSRYYVVAFVTDRGEESEPSPVSQMVEVDANDAVRVTRPPTMGGWGYDARFISKWRLYRSNTSDAGAAWQLVSEQPIGVMEVLDDKPSYELDSLQPQFTWNEPPYRQDGQFEGSPKPVVGSNPYLRGLVGIPNGIMAGFIDNTVAFCEPYVPYAWPVEYQITTEHAIVGLGVFGQTLFVGTTGNPYFITGAHSASMSAEKIDSNQSCASARSVVGVLGGVIYASPDGLCMASPSGVQVITRQHIAREDWQKLDPSSMVAAEHEGVFYLFYSGNGGGCLAFELESQKMGWVDLQADALWVDKYQDRIYVARGTSIVECFAAEARRDGIWRSRARVIPAQTPLSWLKIYGSHSALQPLTVRWFADGQLRHSATITSMEPVRLPPGRWLEHAVEIEGSARVQRVVLCSTAQELRAV